MKKIILILASVLSVTSVNAANICSLSTYSQNGGETLRLELVDPGTAIMQIIDPETLVVENVKIEDLENFVPNFNRDLKGKIVSYIYQVEDEDTLVIIYYKIEDKVMELADPWVTVSGSSKGTVVASTLIGLCYRMHFW